MISAQDHRRIDILCKIFSYIIHFFKFIFDTYTKNSVQGVQNVPQKLSQYTELHNDVELNGIGKLHSSLS